MNNTPFYQDDPLARSQNTREILKQLRTDIILGRFAPGSRLIEAKLAEKLNTSRAPIRAALQILVQEGLVVSLSNGGSEVVGFTTKHVDDLFNLRRILEVRALECILASTTFPFRPLFEVMEILESVQKENGEEVDSTLTSHLDILFHRSLLVMSGNQPMLVAWNSMANILQAVLEITNATHPRFQRFIEGHRTLASLIIQKNRDCITFLEQHIAEPQDIIIGRMEKILNGERSEGRRKGAWKLSEKVEDEGG